MLDAETVGNAFSTVIDQRTGDGAGSALFECINVFDVPKYRFDALKKTFITKGGDTTIDGKTALLRDLEKLAHLHGVRVLKARRAASHSGGL